MTISEGPHPVRRAVVGILLGVLVGCAYVVLAGGRKGSG